MRASPTAETGSTMRRFGDAVVTRDVIDHYRAGANSRREFPASAGVPRPDTGAQAKRRIVREGDGFVGGSHRANREYGAECFVAHELHRVVDVRDHGRLKEIWAEIGATVAAGENSRAALFGLVQLLLDSFELALANHRADVSIGIGG